MDKGELLDIRQDLRQLNRRVTNIHNQIDHTDTAADPDYDFNDMLF